MTALDDLEAVARILDRCTLAGDCWMWPGAKSGNGYGRVRFHGRVEPTHRVTFTVLRGDIPPGLQCDHLCGQRLCVNPWHLDPVTAEENARRATRDEATKNACVHNHAYTPENTMIKTNGRRSCRTCHRQRQRAPAR